MKVYFLRHAEAEDGADDAQRRLTRDGREQCRRVGQFFERLGPGFDAIYTSPLVRAVETAEIVWSLQAEDARPSVVHARALENGTSVRNFSGWLQEAIAGRRNVLLVGHAPSLHGHAARMLGVRDEERVKLPKAGVICVDTEDGQVGVLKWMVTPRCLGALSG